MDTRDLEMEVSRLHAERDGLAEELVDALALMPAETWSRRTCPRCEARRLVPEVSDDGTAWEGWICRACHGRWRFTVPLDAGIILAAEARSAEPEDHDAQAEFPDPGESVMAYSLEFGWCSATYEHGVWWLRTARGNIPCRDATHWCPWPPAPKRDIEQVGGK